MLPALLATFLFSVSVLFASRSVQLLGGAAANASRMVLAMIFLGVWAHGFGAGFGGEALPWFLFSGAIGFGLGDISMFAAISRIGPRLTILITQCLGTPIAGTAEYLFLGVVPSGAELVCVAVILGGVALALAPDNPLEGEVREFRLGVVFGIGSALGQGLGAVVSRKGYAVAEVAGQAMDGGTAAYQRSVAGVLITLLFWAVMRWVVREKEPARPFLVWKKAFPLVMGNAISGPFLGVACFQLALLHTPSAKVLPIVATSPLVTMVLAWAFHGTRPKRKAMVGGVLAVLGAGGLAWFRASRGG